jgi:hypothetical protein
MGDREVKLWKDLIGRERFKEATSGLLQKHDPYLLWDREYHSHGGFFFQNPIGRYRQDPDSLADWVDTNLTLGGMIGVPLVFEAKEIRFYPGDADQAAVRRWVGFDWKANRMEGQSSRPLKLEAHDHLPLPEVDNFPREEIERGTRIDLVEKAKPMRDIINGNHLPCLSSKLNHTIYGLDFLGYGLQAITEVWPKVRTYAVLIGSMWIHK